MVYLFIDLWGWETEGSVGPQSFWFGDLRYVHLDSWQRVNAMGNKGTFLFHNELQDKIKQMFHRLQPTRLTCVIKINCAHKRLQMEKFHSFSESLGSDHRWHNLF